MLGERGGRPVDDGPPETTVSEPMPDPLERPAQLLPASGPRFERRKLPGCRVTQPIERKMHRCDAWLGRIVSWQLRMGTGTGRGKSVV